MHPRVRTLSALARLGIALAVFMTGGSARAANTGDLQLSQASSYPNGVIDLTCGGKYDWVKWGHPVPPDPRERGPFGATTDDYRLKSGANNGTARKAGVTPVIGELSTSHATMNYTYPPPTALWQFGQAGGIALFTWSDSDVSLPGGNTVQDGFQILAQESLANYNWGFSFSVASSTELRQLDLYIGCANSTGVLTARMGQLPPPQDKIVCATGATEKYTIIFDAPAPEYDPLLVGVFQTEMVTRAPITLIAAALRDPQTLDVGNSSCGGVGGAGGTQPDPTFAPRVLACDVAPGARAARAPATLAVLLALAPLLRRRRRAR